MYILEILRENGYQCNYNRNFATRHQLFMILQCYHYQKLFSDQFSKNDFDLSLSNSEMSMRKIFDKLFETGINLGRIISMYVYGALFSLEILKIGMMPAACLLISDWIDDYVVSSLKPALMQLNRWQHYEKLFNLV